MSEKPNWPAFNVERRALSALKPRTGNARTHTEAQIGQIADSIREWGWTQPILIDEAGEIVAGHGRYEAARLLGAAEVPVIVASGWTEAQKRAYVLADNQLALNAGWDEDLLRIEIGALNDLDFDLSLVGFDDSFIAELFADPDDDGDGAEPKVSLADRFGIPPFTVMNAREGWWQDRKRAWLQLGIQSELGRGAPVSGSEMPGVDPKTGKIVRRDLGAEAAARARNSVPKNLALGRGLTNQVGKKGQV